MFVLAHLSDVHLPPLPRPRPGELVSKRGLGFINWLRKRRSIHQAAPLAAVVADLKAHAPDHIAVTGDLINLSLASEYAPGAAWLDALGPSERVTFVPGNHDSYVRAAKGAAEQYWRAHMRGDKGEGFPFVRRRGPTALIGLSTSLPTLPLSATGRLHGDQLAQLGAVLADLGREGLFRVVLIHHPPTDGAHRLRRLVDAAAFRDVLRKHGAELVLHGHHHVSSLVWLNGPRHSIPCLGVPSASGAPDRGDEPAGYNLYEIDGEPGQWRCTAISRGFEAGGDTIRELMRSELAD